MVVKLEIWPRTRHFMTNGRKTRLLNKIIYNSLFLFFVSTKKTHILQTRFDTCLAKFPQMKTSLFERTGGMGARVHPNCGRSRNPPPPYLPKRGPELNNFVGNGPFAPNFI